MAMRPADCKYSETHEWVKLDGKTAIVGITNYAVSQLSDLVHIELPKVGENVEQGAPCGEIESVKTVAELASPVSGKIAEINKDLVDNLTLLSEDPFEEGWLFKVKVKPNVATEMNTLMTSKEYGEFIESTEAEAKEDAESDEVDEDDFM